MSRKAKHAKDLDQLPSQGGSGAGGETPASRATWSLLFPVALVLLATVYLLGQARAPKYDAKADLAEFSRLPVLHGGRVQPIDSYARNTLLMISDRSTFLDEDEQKQPAVRWLLDVMSHHPDASRHRVFRIENKDVLNMLDLEDRPGFFRYSLEELQPKMDEIARQAMNAQERRKKEQELTLFQAKVMELGNQLMMFRQVWEWRAPRVVPPADETDTWRTLPESFELYQRTQQMNPAAQSVAKLMQTYADGDAFAFNKELAEYRAATIGTMPDQTRKAGFEAFFNHFDPFTKSMALYIGVSLLVLAGWLSWAWSQTAGDADGHGAGSGGAGGAADATPAPRGKKALRSHWGDGDLTKALLGGAFWLCALILVLHTFALVARMWIQERPPVTNLYSSAIFIGWGCVGLALFLEWIYRNGLGTAVAAVTGFLTLMVAGGLAADGSDTMEMMQAVLDTNFWLATHVTTITLGYTAAFVAGFLGLAFIIGGVFTPYLSKQNIKALGTMTYGVICFAMLLSFVGTVLGGIWADQSWGRFWGWDPKENGALMIVIWNALILHARWGGMVRERGIAVLAVAGNIITAWSWFGVNMLGVGLHSYGFMDSAAFWLIAFVLSQLVIIGIGMLPMTAWWSFSAQTAKPRPSFIPSVATATGLALAASLVLMAVSSY